MIKELEAVWKIAVLGYRDFWYFFNLLKHLKKAKAISNSLMTLLKLQKKCFFKADFDFV